METIETAFEGLKVIKPTIYEDNRGRFYEHWQGKRYREALGMDISFVQDDFSVSKKNVLRGLHGQKSQSKLIETVVGKVWDILVDVRPQSKTYKQYFSIYLSEDEPTQVFVPDGFVHGFCVLSDYAVMHYKCSTCHDKTLEYGYRYNDPSFGISWPDLPFILSAKDNDQPFFNR